MMAGIQHTPAPNGYIRRIPGDDAPVHHRSPLDVKRLPVGQLDDARLIFLPGLISLHLGVPEIRPVQLRPIRKQKQRQGQIPVHLNTELHGSGQG
ncbi:hypothetical protein D3C76_1530600 [compost metagenome]